MIFLLIITPFAGMLADRFGRKTILAAGAAGFTALSWPLFLLLDHPVTIMILLGQCGFALPARFRLPWWRCIRVVSAAPPCPSPTMRRWDWPAAPRR
jgi:MFS family permease